MKPDVVFFGDNVPKPKVDFIYDQVERADSMLVVGSSLFVSICSLEHFETRYQNMIRICFWHNRTIRLGAFDVASYRSQNDSLHSSSHISTKPQD